MPARLPAAVAVAVASLLLLAGCSTEHTVIIPQEKLQAEVDKKFPIKRGSDALVEVELTSPRVTLPGEARLAATADVHASWPDPSQVDVPAAAVGEDATLAERAQDAARRLAAAVDGLSTAPRAEGDGTLSASGRLAYVPAEGAFYLQELQIDALEVEGLDPKHADKARVAGELALGAALEGWPVHTLDESLQQRAARLVLKEVRAEPDGLHVTLGR